MQANAKWPTQSISNSSGGGTAVTGLLGGQKEPTIAPDLSGGDLGNATLFEENLSGANLSGASLVMAGLIMADLSGADLSGADLSLANLSHADLGGANLSCANLNSSAVLVGANRGRCRSHLGVPRLRRFRMEREAQQGH